MQLILRDAGKHCIVCDPATAESQSVLCSGNRLRRLRSTEIDGQVFLVDKRVTGLT
jgi:hypothetical protein